jgi:hypothetical protein
MKVGASTGLGMSPIVLRLMLVGPVDPARVGEGGGCPCRLDNTWGSGRTASRSDVTPRRSSINSRPSLDATAVNRSALCVLASAARELAALFLAQDQRFDPHAGQFWDAATSSSSRA